MSQREMTISDKTSMSLKTQKRLSVTYTIGYFVILFTYLIYMPQAGIVLPEGNAAIANLLIGILTGEVPRVNAFWFGSSFGSKVKDNK